MSVATGFPHIVLDEKGQARVGNTRIKVKHLVAERLANGWSPEETAFQHPGLSLAQVFSALAYYEENRATIDAEIERDRDAIGHLGHPQDESPLARRLRTLRRT